MKNESAADRVARMILGVTLGLIAWFALDLSTGGMLGVVAGVVAVVLFATGLIGFCPAYKVCGMSTCRVTPGPGPGPAA